MEPDESQTVSTGEKTGSGNIKTIVDKVRIWKGKKLHILAVENQNYVDYQMVLRNMLSESIGYRKQWKRKKRAHEEAQDFKERNEYLSGMKKDERFAPVITLVVYFGTDSPWDGARCLYDLLEIDDELKEYVTNYRLNLYDCQEHDSFEEYRTGLRQVFETVRYGKDKEKLKEVMEENREAYSRIDSDTRDMLEVVANVRIPEAFKTVEKGEERYDMCKAFEDMRQEGIDIGMERGIREGKAEGIIETGIELGLTKDDIVQRLQNKLDVSLQKAQEYFEMFEKQMV